MKIKKRQMAAIAVTLALFGAVAPDSRISSRPATARAARAQVRAPGTIVQAPLPSIETAGAHATFASGWPQPGYDATNAGFNPNEHGLNGSNVATLKQLWHHGGDGTYSDPVIGNGFVALTTRAGGRCSGIEVLNQTSGKPVWSVPIKAFECTNPVLSGGTLLMVTNNPWKLYAWKLSTGQPLQMKTFGHTRFTGLTVGEDPPAARGSSPRPPALFLNGANGWVKSLSLDGKQVWAFNTRSTLVDSRAVLYGGNVYVVSSSGKVFAIGAMRGRLSWKTAIAATFSLGDIKLAATDGKLFISSGPDKLYAINIGSAEQKTRGRVVWKDIGMGYNTDFAVAYHELFITAPPQGPHGQGPSVFALDDSNGKQLWSFKTGYVGVKPSVAGGVVYVSNDGVGTTSKFFAIDARTGKELQSGPGAGSYPSCPAITGGRVYLSNYAFGIPPWS